MISHKSCAKCGILYLVHKDKCRICGEELRLYDFDNKWELNFEKYKMTGKFKLSSGETSDVYFDIKRAMSEPVMLRQMAESVIDKFGNKHLTGIDVIIGIDYGGVPLAISVSMLTGVPYAILRKTEKTHGTMRRIEGCQKIGSVLLLDDVKTTGRSITDAIEYLHSLGYTVVETDVALDRSNFK